MVLNPVRVGIVRIPAEWPWRSYRAMIGEADPPPWLETRWILSVFAPTEAEAVGHYVRFVAAGKGQPSPWEQLKQQVFLGSDVFVEAMRRKVPADRDLREIPQARARPSARPSARPPWLITRRSTQDAIERSLRPTPAVAIPCGRSATTSAYTTPASARSCKRLVRQNERPRDCTFDARRLAK